MRTASIALLLILCAVEMPAQGVNLGNPPVLNFSKKHFKAVSQTWSISQDSNGVMWFADNDGLIEFDGAHWRLHPISNGTIVRSAKSGDNETVYVGGQGDFGFFAPDARGVLQYHSLKNLLPESARKFNDVWNVEVTREGVFFRTDNQVFRYHKEKLAPMVPNEKSLFFMGKWQGKLLVQDGEETLYVFENDRFRQLGHPEKFTGGRISAILPLNADTILVTTIQNGIFYFSGNTFEPWKTQDDNLIINNRIYCADLLADGKLALGTSLNGLVILDRQRRICHHLNKKSGLQNNTVLSLFTSKNGGLWLGLDKGIDFVDVHSPFSTFFPDGELQGTGYTAGINNGKLYFGTNTGLYATDWKSYYAPGEKEKFSPVQNSDGQVWSLTNVNNQLLLGHHEGAFEVNGLTANKLTNLPGVWRFVPWSDDVLIAGHYNGMALFLPSENGWVFDTILKNFGESSRILAKDRHNNIWMAHPYRGIYRIEVFPENKTVKAEHLGAKQGLPSDMGNHLFQLGEKMVFTGEKGVFDYDENKRRFAPNAQFNQYFGEQTHVKYLRQDEAGNIWYVTDAETGVLLVESDALEKKVRKMPIPELNDKLTGGFPFLLPVSNQNVFVATGQGFIHFNPAAYKSADSTLRLVLHEVRLKKEPDSLLFGGHPSGLATHFDIVLKSHQNALSFNFSATDYPGGEYIRYAHYLEGAEQTWSDWDTRPEVAFNNLNPGSYVFHVKAKNQYGVESEVRSFPFKILPPWYASNWAYAFYVMVLLGIVAGIIYRQQKKFEKEKHVLQSRHQQREAQHQLQVQLSEEAINRLQNEKLEAEVHHKTQELASATMHLVQKNEILNSVREALDRLKEKGTSSTELQDEIARITKMVDQDASIDDDWEHFSKNFDEVHSDFLKRLGEQFANLSPNDYKLCAYLRINLSSKDIAALMNISLRSVEASRYRLRKRLGLDTEVNLTEFLMRF
ncbi:MAG: hypothetical protein IT270_16555 [Saprospiraceae bacterium]|nr:hypothetical protein [Saprospiraceae bacterium]